MGYLPALPAPKKLISLSCKIILFTYFYILKSRELVRGFLIPGKSREPARGFLISGKSRELVRGFLIFSNFLWHILFVIPSEAEESRGNEFFLLPRGRVMLLIKFFLREGKVVPLVKQALPRDVSTALRLLNMTKRKRASFRAKPRNLVETNR